MIFAQAGILLALLFVTLPLVVRTVQPVLLELDETEEEAARVLGATRWMTFRKVVLPKLRAGIVGGGLLAFARAIGEFGAIVIVSGNILNETLTAPVLIFQLSSQFRIEEAAAISAMLFAISFVLVLRDRAAASVSGRSEAVPMSAAVDPRPPKLGASSRRRLVHGGFTVAAFAYVGILVLAPLIGITWQAVEAGVVADLGAAPLARRDARVSAHRDHHGHHRRRDDRASG